VHPPGCCLQPSSLHGCEDFSTPTVDNGGSPFMIRVSTGSRQPQHVAWTLEWLVHEQAIALGHSIESSSALTYNSHLQSYLAFCKLHNRHIEPTPETLSFYVVFMCHHINPWSMSAYLSGICNTLEPHFQDIWKAWLRPIVT